MAKRKKELERLPVKDGELPPPLLKGYKKNFDTLKRACLNGDLALVSAVRKSDKMPVGLLAAIVLDDETNEYTCVPFAVMAEGNPYEDFELRWADAEPEPEPAATPG